jgi:malonyl CoA-acyl carrier protein transacylase
MKPAAERLRERLAEVHIATPRHPGDQQHRRGRCRPTPTPSATRCTARPSARCAGWSWCRRCKARGLTHVIECGPGKVLAGMVKRIDAELASADPVRPGQPGRRERTARMSLATPPQIALVTGASRGIGRAIALTLAQQGFKVIGTATSDDRRRRHHRGADPPAWPRHGAERDRRPHSTPRSTPSSSSTAVCTCWSTTPASRATPWPCA